MLNKKQAKLLFFSFFFLLAIIVLACSEKNNEQIVEASSEPTATPVVISVQITSEPYVSPEPLIMDQWYLDHIKDLEKNIREFGSCESETEIQKKASSMFIDPSRKMIAFTFDDGPRD